MRETGSSTPPAVEPRPTYTELFDTGPVNVGPRPPRPRWRWPLGLFIATCLSTWLSGGLAFAFWLMFTLTAHEFGHYIQARRYGVAASLPYFIPLPLFSPWGTMGAVIVMPPRTPDRQSLFDIGATGPIAGLIPTLGLCAYGLHLSDIVANDSVENTITLGDPLILQWMADWILGPIPEGHTILIHPIGFAGWVGLLVTALNLIPIGQFDGGHILYALLREKAHTFSTALANILTVLVLGAFIAHQWGGYENYYWTWWLMVLLMRLIGTRHPPTLNDAKPLSLGRTVVGWLLLLFVPIGLTPTPLIPPSG